MNKNVKRVRKSFNKMESINKQLAAERAILSKAAKGSHLEKQQREKIKEIQKEAIFTALFAIAALNA